MPLYQGKSKLNKRIIKKINRPKDYDKQVNLLAAALACFAVAGLLAAYLYGG